MTISKPLKSDLSGDEIIRNQQQADEPCGRDAGDTPSNTTTQKPDPSAESLAKLGRKRRSAPGSG